MSDTPTSLPQLRRMDQATIAMILKWVASIFQILGYSATAFAVTPVNVYFFLAGLVGWFIVGVLWRDKAIMLIHMVALAAMAAGLASS